MPSSKKKTEKLQEQLKSTKKRLDETEDRLAVDNFPKEEERRMKEKNEHRKEMMAGLESELEAGSDIAGTEKEGKFDPINELGRR